MIRSNDDSIALPLLLFLLLACSVRCQDATEPNDITVTATSPAVPTGVDVSRLEDHLTRVYPWNRDEYPNPQLSPRYCRNLFASNICDPDDILTEKEKSHIDKKIRQLADLKCYCDKCTINTSGISVGVALMKAIYKDYMVHPINNTKNFTETLRKNWNFGLCDNDIVILIALTDRQWYPAIGDRLLRIIPPASLESVKEKTKKAFANEEIYQGIQGFLQGIETTLRERETTRASQDSLTFDEEDGHGDIAYFLGFSFLAFLIVALICVGVYMFLSWNQRRRQASPSDPGAIEKKEPIDFVSDEEDVVVYDRQSSEEQKKSSSAWSDIRGRLTSHRKQPGTDAEKAILNEQAPVTRDESIEQNETAVKTVTTFSDEEIEHVDIENIKTIQDNAVYRETTVTVDDTVSHDSH